MIKEIELHKGDTCSNAKLCHECVMVNIISYITFTSQY